MEAVIKLRGKHIVAGDQLTLLDDTQATVDCSAESTYSEYSNVTQIIISPQGSNSIGGEGGTWKIEGSITIDGTEYDLFIGAPEPSPVTLIVTPTPPIDLQNANVVLSKRDGSDFTSEEIVGLQITMQSAGLLTFLDGGTVYLWRSGGTNYFRMEKAATYGAEITLINGGYEQTLASIELGL